MIISVHPKTENDALSNIPSIKQELIEIGYTGYLSDKLLINIYNILTWATKDSSFNALVKKHPEVADITALLETIEYTLFLKHDLRKSLASLYLHLSLILDLRTLVKGEVKYFNNQGECIANKKYNDDDFANSNLYASYISDRLEIPKDSLIFNYVFGEMVTRKTAIGNISTISELAKSCNKADLVRPDMLKKAINNELKVRDAKTEMPKQVLYVLQDATFSMEAFINRIHSTRSLILKKAEELGVDVDWRYVNTKVFDNVYYTSEAVGSNADIDTTLKFQGSTVDIEKVLKDKTYYNKNVVIVTDGTDSFNFNFNTKAKTLSVLSFTENNIIKQKLTSYGRFFKI